MSKIVKFYNYKESLYFNDIKSINNKIKQNKIYNQNQKKILDYSLKFAKLNNQSKILEIGCGFLLYHNVHPNYIGLDKNPLILKVAKNFIKKKLNLIVGSATRIPLKKNQIDFIFSFATLEHIERPDLALNEMDRVLKKGLFLLLAPAWNCRKYTVQKLQFRRYKDLSIVLKISKFFIPLQNNFLFRGILKLPYRIWDEFKYLIKKKVKFRYTRMYPSYQLWNKYPSIADDNAVASMDSHSAIMFFISRGYDCISHKSFIQRFFCRGSFVLLKKYTENQSHNV